MRKKNVAMQNVFISIEYLLIRHRADLFIFYQRKLRPKTMQPAWKELEVEP